MEAPRPSEELIHQAGILSFLLPLRASPALRTAQLTPSPDRDFPAAADHRSASPLPIEDLSMRALLTTGLAVALGVVAAAPALPNVQPATPVWGTGAVEGTVRLDAKERPAPAMLSPYARRRYSPPTPAARESGGASDVVVYLLAEGETPTPPTRVASIAQRNLAIAPHVTVVQVGTRIDFPNEDKVFHNLFSLSSPHPFNLGRYPRPQSRSEVFRKAGVVRMFCDIHSDMSGVILVVDTPYFTRPDASGHFVLDGIPEGRHKLVAWHESAGADTVEVVVGAGGTVTASLRLPS